MSGRARIHGVTGRARYATQAGLARMGCMVLSFDRLPFAKPPVLGQLLCSPRGRRQNACAVCQTHLEHADVRVVLSCKLQGQQTRRRARRDVGFLPSPITDSEHTGANGSKLPA